MPAEHLVTVPAWGVVGAVLAAMALAALLAWALRRAALARHRELGMRRLIDQSPHLIALLDSRGALVHLNRTGRSWLRVEIDDVRGRPLHELPDGRIDASQGLALAAAVDEVFALDQEGVTRAHELQVALPDGTSLCLDCALRLIPATPGRAPHVLLEARDVSLRKSAEEKLRLAAAVFDEAREGIVLCDDAERVVSVNQAFCDLSGHASDELLGTALCALPFGFGDPDQRHRLLSALDRDGHWQGEVRNISRDGHERVCWVSLARREGGPGAGAGDRASSQGSHTIVLLNDVTQFREAERNLARMAHLDGLTGLPNRALFADRVGQLIGNARREQRPFSLMYMDLDQFKHVNESLGHRVGDGLLAAIGQRLQRRLREGDTVARLGGDEFAILLPGADADAAAQVANKLMEAVAQPVDVMGHELAVTMSVGIAVFPSDGDDHESLSRHADMAMFRAKHEGRATARFFAEGMQSRSARHLQLEAALRRALERQELLLHYQPKLSADGRRVTGVEALVRWQHPELGLVSPAEFIPLAESSGLILPIGEWVMRTAARQARAWTDAGMPAMSMAVNLSAVQFRHPALVEVVRGALADAGLAPHWLELELTESVVAEDAAGAIETMDALRALGVRLSIDDFGTGYSSLSNLKRFPIHQLKIDRSFVRDIHEDPDDRAIVKAIIQMAHALQLEVVAEGVETDEQLHFLRREGCDLVQGYRYCRPVDAEALTVWARAHRVQQDVRAADEAAGPGSTGIAAPTNDNARREDGRAGGPVVPASVSAG